MVKRMQIIHEPNHEMHLISLIFGIFLPQLVCSYRDENYLGLVKLRTINQRTFTLKKCYRRKTFRGMGREILKWQETVNSQDFVWIFFPEKVIFPCGSSLRTTRILYTCFDCYQTLSCGWIRLKKTLTACKLLTQSRVGGKYHCTTDKNITKT